MKNILFITWDGPQTTYMEGLFMPIFDEIQRQSEYCFHIIQFTWANEAQTNATKNTAEKYGIAYSKAAIIRKPNAILGSVITIHKGIKFIKKYIAEHDIEIVMPRSTMPAMMVNRLKNRNFKLLFDADGFPLEERVDFGGLSKKSSQYQFLKKEETAILLSADGVITRSEKAIAIHSDTIGDKKAGKFSVVRNGRNTDFFKPNADFKSQTKIALGIPEKAVVFAYCGSLGAQYGWNEMMSIFTAYHKINPDSFFLILTGNAEYLQEKIPSALAQFIITKKVPFAEVPKYLSAADFAFAIREPKWSMQGVAPIKLGEYLLMGIPTIASAGIGDTENILRKFRSCFLFSHDDVGAVDKTLQFIDANKSADSENIRELAIDYFSIENSARSYINALRKLK